MIVTTATVKSMHHIVIIGLMGAGKSTIGRALAQRLGRPFVDTDPITEANAGASLPEILAMGGEHTLRDAETRSLRQALAGTTPAVIAAAAGTVLDPDNRRRLAHEAWTVWLRARPETLAARVSQGPRRPWLGGDDLPVLQQMERERRALFEEAAAEIIDVDARGAGEIVEAIASRWLTG